MGDIVQEWQIYGNRVLSGTIKIDGAKNALVAILPATILVKSIVELDNVPPLNDTYALIEILKELDVKVIYDNRSKMILDSRGVKNIDLISNNVKKLRASYYFMGALLGLYKRARVLSPGGCGFASRPIDLHLKAFSDMGIVHEVESDVYTFKRVGKGKRIIEFSKVSVGASVNAILASCKRRGVTTLLNVAKEPEIDDLIDFLNKCGANVKRVNNTIVIRGVSELHGCRHSIIEDRIEAGTYLIIGACIGENLRIKYKTPHKLKSLIDTLIMCGVDVKIEDDCMCVSMAKEIQDTYIICDVYPYIPTDLQQPLSILFTKTRNKSVLQDKVYPSRYTQIDDLSKMGFKMQVIDGRLEVYNSLNITSSTVECKDLRGGVSLVIASLMGEGISRIRNVDHIKRGYFDMLNKLKKVGAVVYEKA